MRGLVILLVLLFSSSCFAQDGLVAPYVRYGERYSNPPRIYSGGTYLGEVSQNRYAPDSISNPYGRFGSRYSPASVNNPYSPYGQYRTQPVWIYQRGR